MTIFTHVALGTNDLNKARAFYDKVLAPLGLKRIKDLGDRGSCWGQDREEFIVLTPADGRPATAANGGTVSFEAPSRSAVAGLPSAGFSTMNSSLDWPQHEPPSPKSFSRFNPSGPRTAS